MSLLDHHFLAWFSPRLQQFAHATGPAHRMARPCQGILHRSRSHALREQPGRARCRSRAESRCWTSLRCTTLLLHRLRARCRIGIAGYAELPLVSLALAFVGAAAVIAMAALICDFRLFRPLGYYGQHSIVIYLAFLIPMSVTRKILTATGIFQDVGWRALIATLGGVIGALAGYWLVRGTRWRFLFERPSWVSVAPRRTPTSSAPQSSRGSFAASAEPRR